MKKMQLYHFANTYANFQFYFFAICERKSQTYQKKRRSESSRLFGRRNLFPFDLFEEDMGNVYSNPPPEPLSETSETMPNFNNLFQECVPKMMRVTDDLYRMVLLQSSNIRDFQNMMIGLLTIVGIFIFLVLALLIIIGVLIFFILKYRNGKQKRRRRSNRGKHRFNDIRSEHSSIHNRYINENSDAHSDGSFDDVLICGECHFRTNDITEFANHKSLECSNITKLRMFFKSIIFITAAAYGTPLLTTSVSVAATPSVSSLINSEDPSMFKARVFVGNLNKTRVPREDLVGLFKCCGDVLGATVSKGYALIQFSSQAEAELSVQTLNGYTWEGSKLDVKILTLYSTNDAIDCSNVSQTLNQTHSSGINFAVGTSMHNAHITNTTLNASFCCLDSLKPLNV